MQIQEADERWKCGVGIIFFRGIRKILEEKKQKNNTDPNAVEHFKEALGEFNNLMESKKNNVFSSNEMRRFLEEKDLLCPEIEELLKDYKEFETTGEYRRRDVFVKL